MKRRRFSFLVPLAAVIFTCLCLVAGCGKKGPPRLPLNQGNVINPPVNLAYTLDENRVILTWAHKADPVNAKILAEGFEVFVATKDVNGCQGCPFIFKSAGIVPMPRKTFTYELAPKLNYYFRVRAMGADGMTSEFSSTLNIDRE